MGDYKKMELYKNERVTLHCHYYYFLFTKITKFIYNFTGLLFSPVNKKHF